MLQRLPVPLRLLAIPLIYSGLAGCARSDTPFPSLAPRPIEQIPIGNPAPESLPIATSSGVADSALDSAAARELAAAEASVAPFDAQFARTRDAVNAAKGTAPGTERWVVAQQAISRLVELRGPAESATASLDHMRIEAAQRQPQVDTHALEAAWSRANAIQQSQSDAYTALANALTPA
jgi:hypothetical protein